MNNEVILALQAAALAGDYKLAAELKGDAQICLHCGFRVDRREYLLCTACASNWSVCTALGRSLHVRLGYDRLMLVMDVASMIDFAKNEVILAIQAAALASNYTLVMELRVCYALKVCLHCAGTLDNPVMLLCHRCGMDNNIWAAVYSWNWNA
jgi:hypothetical protein